VSGATSIKKGMMCMAKKFKQAMNGKGKVDA
jgi:hypothetical protein